MMPTCILLQLLLQNYFLLKGCLRKCSTATLPERFTHNSYLLLLRIHARRSFVNTKMTVFLLTIVVSTSILHSEQILHQHWVIIYEKIFAIHQSFRGDAGCCYDLQLHQPCLDTCKSLGYANTCPVETNTV